MVDIGLNFSEGQAIEPMHDDRSRQGYYIAYASGREELRQLQERVESTLHLVYRQ